MFKPIRFNQPSLVGEEITEVLQAIQNMQISGNGYFCKQAQVMLQQQLGIKKALLTTSCTHALEMAAILLDLQPGDEVIVPSYTFVTTALAFVMHGAKPVFADIRPDTLNIDECRLESLITPKTRAIVVVHYAGVSCEMDAILALAQQHGLMVIEDNAHGLYGQYKGRYLGSLGVLATQSFHETKNITCGEGGALLINNDSYIERAEIIHEKGTNRSLFFRGQVDKYSWVDKGSSYVLADLLAAFLHAQLQQAEKIQAKRQQLWATYYHGLADWAQCNDIKLPYIPSDCQQAYHMFYLILPNFTARCALIKFLETHGIYALFHYVPLHSSKMGLQYGGAIAACPVTDQVSQCLLRLPFYYSMTDEDVARVIQQVTQFSINPG